ncbi:MAG: M14 family metallopeptidase [Chloroflexota bacterium]
MNFNHYFTNQELETLLPEWVAAHPNLAKLTRIGQSYQQRPIWLMTLTNQATGPDTDKPAVWIDANIHATEISGTTVAMHLIHTLLEGYGQDERITRLLDNGVYYIVPRINPDGSELAMADNPRYIRSGARPYPWPEKDDGLHEQDIDNDGHILQMRIPDPHGDWKVSSLDPRLLEKRGPEEHGGQYYRLLPEGLIDDYDGYQIKLAKVPEGLDFNRNFPFEWRPEGDQNGAGPYPASEPEIKALLDFISQHPNINLAITYHTFSRAILRSYSTKADEEMEAEDLWVTKKIGQIGSQLTSYRCVSTFHDFKYHPKEITTGAFDDWMYDHLGVFCYTIELWDLPTEAGIKDRKFIDWFREHPHEEDVQILKWIDENGGPQAYVAWRPFDHPQLGGVELGGWDQMYTWRNPPLAFIGTEAERNTPFALALGDLLPCLALHTLKVTPLGNHDYHVNLVIENTGFLPTYTSAQGKKRKAVRPVRLELELPQDVQIVDGKRRSDLGHLEGRSNKLDTTMLWGESPTDHRARAEWVLHSETDAEITIHVRSERAGSLHLTAKLGSIGG